MKTKRIISGLLSVLLCLSLVIGMVPLIPAVSAAEVDPTGMCPECAAHKLEAASISTILVDEGAAYTVSAKTVHLEDDYVIDKQVKFYGKCHICLNGKTLSLKSGFLLSTNPSNPTVLTICDCTGEGAIVLDESLRSTGSDFPLITVASGSTLVLYGGTIGYNNTTIDGGAVNLSNGGTFEMKGGVIKGNTSGSGAVKLSGTSSTLNISDGWITGNNATTYGGAIMAEGGTITMTGGHITENVANHSGGAICLYTNTALNMSGGSIENNKGANNAGAVFVKDAASSMTVSGTAFIGNNALLNGVDNASEIWTVGNLTINGGTITTTDNTTLSNVGRYGIRVAGANAVFTMTGGVINGTPKWNAVFLNAIKSANISGSAVVEAKGIKLNGNESSVTVEKLTAGASITFANSESGPAVSEDGTVYKNGLVYTYNPASATQARMVLGSSLNIQFKLPDALADETVTVEGGVTYDQDGQIITVYRNPAQMAEDITLNIGAYTYTCSVQDYAERLIAKEGTTQALKNVLIDMLNYGDAAQKAYPTYGPAMTLGDYADDSTTVDPTDFEKKEKGNASLILSDGIALRVSGFTNATEGAAATYKFTSWNGDNYTVNTKVLKEGSTLYVLADQISVADAFAMVTVTVGDEVVSDSVAAYCDRQTGELYTALLKFAAAAKELLA